MKGNVVDLAVAVVIGAAFGAVVTALVDKIIMPLIAGIVGSPSFDGFLVWSIKPDVNVEFGAFITVLVNFLLVAAAIYFIVVVPMKKVSEIQAARAGVVEEEEAVDPQVELLAEIRDELRRRAL